VSVASYHHSNHGHGHTVAGWVASSLLHGSLALSALFFLQRMHLVPQPEPFKWNVAMVTPAPIHEAISPSSLEPQAPRNEEPVSRNSPSASVPAVLPEIAQPPVTPPAAEPSKTAVSVQPFTPARELPRTETVTETKRDATTSPPAAAATPSAPLLSAQSTELPAAMPAQDPSLASPPPISESAYAPAPAAPESQTQTAAMSPAGPARTTKRDYGWLADLMARWVENLEKRYPVSLRTEGIQGKVTLMAILNEDGRLSDVKVAKSSGNEELDQVAVEDVMKGTPVMLSRPLERPQMPVKLSIIYDLRSAH